MRSRSRDRERATRARDVLRRALTGALAIMIAVAAVVSGRSYLFCVPMDAVVETCCMATHEDPSDTTNDPTAPRVKGECCDTHAVGDLPTARGAAASLELPPAVLTVTPVAPVIAVAYALAWRGAAIPVARRGDPIRAGPGSGARRCISLSVFRC